MAYLGKILLLVLLQVLSSSCQDVNRLYKQICLDPEAKHVPGEFFRDARVNGKGDCQSVVSCSNGGLSYLRCPTGLHFDIEEQTCQWAAEVVNCDIVERTESVLSDGEISSSATPCNVETCKLPNCFCSTTGKEIPAGFKTGIFFYFVGLATL